ncbi:MAG: hypothetical protein ACPHF4_01560, partial [Rubripirellula sp.]
MASSDGLMLGSKSLRFTSIPTVNLSWECYFGAAAASGQAGWPRCCTAPIAGVETFGGRATPPHNRIDRQDPETLSHRQKLPPASQTSRRESWC